MAQQHINTSTPNDGLGDTLRDSQVKAESNFNELYANKVDKVTGKELSDNNFSDVDKAKLDSLDPLAVTQSDWNQGDNLEPDYIKNKPENISEFFNDAEYVTPSVIDGLEEKVNKISEITSYSELSYPNEKATHDALDLKLNISDLPTNLTLYPTTVASDISGYIKMVTSINDPDYDEPAVDVTTPAISTTAQLLSSRATVAGVLVGQPGVFNITSYGHIRRLSGTGTANFYFETYQRNAAGTETLICTSGNTLPVSSAVYSEFTASSVWNNGIFLATDRIVIKAYANRISGGTDPVYQIQFGGETPVRVVLPVPFSVVDAGYELIANKQNALTADLTNIKYPTVTAVNGGLASKADKQGTILYHSVKWFTPSSSVSNVGATVTSIGTQFTSAMVGSILRINDEDRLIITYTSTTVVVVDFAYSTNYSGVVAGSWGVYGIITKVFSDGKIGFYNAQGAIQFGINGGGDNTRLYATQFATYDGSIGFGSFSLRLAGTNPINWSNDSGYGGTKDIGLRRNSAGILEIYDGITATGLLANRRDLMVRKLLVNKSTDNGVDALQVEGTISMSPATLSTQGVVKSQLDLKADLSGVVLNTTNQTVAGNKTFTGDTGLKKVFASTQNADTTIYVDNVSTGKGIEIRNYSIGGNGTAIFIAQENIGKAIDIAITGSGTGTNINNTGTGIGTIWNKGSSVTSDFLQIKNNGTTIASINYLGELTTPKIINTGVIRLQNYTVATLPTGAQGDTAYVTDALTPTYLGIAVGGGSVICPVFFNGTNWIT